MCPLPVVIVDDNEATVTTSKGNLVALVVPPVGMRLSIDHITENDHVPKKRLRQNYSELFFARIWMRFSSNSLDLTPSVLANPSISASLICIDGNRLGGSITMAGWAHPVILVLQDSPKK